MYLRTVMHKCFEAEVIPRGSLAAGKRIPRLDVLMLRSCLGLVVIASVLYLLPYLTLRNRSLNATLQYLHVAASALPQPGS